MADTPFGITFSKVVNLLTAVFLFIAAAFISMIALYAFMTGRQTAGAPASSLLGGLTALFLAGLAIVPAILILFLNKKIKEGAPAARAWQIILSCFGLFGFPVGTLLHGGILYFFLFEPKTKAFFETPTQK